MNDVTERPAIVEDHHLEYLDLLRLTGVTNMFSAAPWLEDEFGFSRAEARTILTYWMKTFSERHPQGAR